MKKHASIKFLNFKGPIYFILRYKSFFSNFFLYFYFFRGPDHRSGTITACFLRLNPLSSDPFENKSSSEEPCAFFGITASWMTWCKCRCMAVEAREKGCIYSTWRINRRITIRLGARDGERRTSILIDILFSRHFCSRNKR